MKRMGSELQDAGKEMDRLKALSDGVFAIVLTLLVLELKIPQIKTHDEVLHVLGSLAPAFVSYVLSFFIIGLYWIVHTRIVRHMTGYDRGILWLNLLFLFFISILPFFTALSGQKLSLKLPWQLYAGNVALVGIMGALLWRSALKKRFVEEAVTPKLAAYLTARGVLVPFIFATSILVAAFNVELARFAPILIPPAMAIIHRRYARA